MTEKFESPSSAGEPRRPRRWLRWTRDIALLLLVVAAVQWWQSRHLAQDAAPPLVGLLVDGTPFQLSPGSAPILVHFWAEWCPVCRLGQDSIDAIAADWPTITVATSSGTADEVSDYLVENALTMPTLVDESGAIARGWGVDGVPATFIVSRDGTIAHASMGYSTGLGLRLRLWLARL